MRNGLHIVHQEIGGTLHDGVVLPQEVLIACEQIVLPEVGGEPGSTRGEHTPCGAIYRTGYAPEVCVMMGYPAATVIHGTGSLGACMAKVLDHGEQRLLRLGEITYECRPVVHLGIDVDGVF